MQAHWLAGRAAVLSSVLLAVGALAGFSPGDAVASTCVSWTGTQPANPSNQGDSLISVAVLSACNGWAVGTQQAGIATHTLTEHWNGQAWTPMPSANPGGSSNRSEFSAIAARSAADAWAVGDYSNGTASQTLIELLSGGTWEQIASPDPGGTSHQNILDGVAITSPKDAWAVGSYNTGTGTGTVVHSLIVHWNGVKWSKVRSPNPSATTNEFFGVTATSAKNAWAVGASADTHGFLRTLIAHWNGRKWTRVPSPDPGTGNILSAVAASSAASAWAVGTYFSKATPQSLLERWNGKTWKHISAPTLDNASVPGSLASITVLSAKAAWAVGTYTSSGNRTLAAHWNGTTWTRVASPDLGSFNEFSGVGASSPTNVWAVGTYDTGGPNLTLGFHCC